MVERSAAPRGASSAGRSGEPGRRGSSCRRAPPRRAQRSGESRLPAGSAPRRIGYVVRRKICVTTTGVVDSVTLVKGADSLLDDNVLRAVKEWHFAPVFAGQQAHSLVLPSAVFEFTRVNKGDNDGLHAGRTLERDGLHRARGRGGADRHVALRAGHRGRPAADVSPRGARLSRGYVEALAPLVEAARTTARGGRPGEEVRRQPGGQGDRRRPPRIRPRARSPGRQRRATGVRRRRDRQPGDGARARSGSWPDCGAGCRCWRRSPRRRRSSACSAPSAASSPPSRSWPIRPRGAAASGRSRPASPRRSSPPPSAWASPSSPSGSTTTSRRGSTTLTIDIDETASELVDTILRGGAV